MVEAKVINFLEAVRELELTRKRRVVLAHQTIFSLTQFVHDVWSDRQAIGQAEPWLEVLDRSLQNALFTGKYDPMSSRQIIGQTGELFVNFKKSNHDRKYISSALLEWDKKFVRAGGLQDPEFVDKIKEAAKQ